MTDSATPTAWKRTTVREIVQGLYDGPHATPKPASEGPVFLGIKNITDDGRLDLSEIRHVSEGEFPKWTKRVLPQPGDIVFTYEATLNRYAIIPEGFRGCLGRRLALIRPNLEKVDTRYLFYYFFGEDWRGVIAQNTLSGSTVDRIPLTQFPNFELKLPPLATQREAASVLSAYDDLIENNTRRIKILEEMAQRIYREWFVHFRFPGCEKVEMVDSELGPIPEGWKIVKLVGACDLVMGQSPKSEYYNDEGKGLPFHQGVTDFGLRFPTNRLYCTIENRISEAGDILFSVRAPVGRINLTTQKIVIGRGLSAIRSKMGYQAFMFQQLKEKFQEEDSIGGGTIFKAVTKSDMQNIRLLQPEDALIQRFESIVKPVFRLIENLSFKNVNLRHTRDLLLPKLISGEVNVEGVESDVGARDSSESEYVST